MEKLTSLKLIYPSATKLMDEIVLLLVVQTPLGDLSFDWFFIIILGRLVLQ